MSAESLLEEIKRYVRFSEEDARELQRFGEVARPHFARVTEEFYDRIREHEEAHRVLIDESQIERLKQSLTRWMERIFCGTYDEAYFQETAKIGRSHVRVGLPQRYMFTAMALMRLSFDAIARAELGDANGRVSNAISRILDLELAIMSETYRDDSLARVQRMERLEKEEVNRSLVQAEHRYKNAVELANILIVGLDRQSRIRLFNREAERVTDFGREDVIGLSFAEALLPPELAESQDTILRRASAGDLPDSKPFETLLRTRSGNTKEVRFQLAYAPSELGNEVVLFAIGQDITEQNALARRVRQSERLAAVGTLAAGLAHEIRNPLNGAQLHVTFLERGLKRAGVEDPEAMEAILVVRDEIQRLSSLVSEFLEFARPRPLSVKPVAVRALCERAFQILGKTDSVLLKLDLPASEMMLEVDSGRMSQVLINLLRNAVEAAETIGGGTVILRVRRLPLKALFEVEDNGPGLSNPDAPIFDPFFTTKSNGTGLGLAIVHRIVTDHEGTIDVQSQPGRTTFRVTIPLQPGQNTFTR